MAEEKKKTGVAKKVVKKAAKTEKSAVGDRAAGVTKKSMKKKKNEEPFQHSVEGAVDRREFARSLGRIHHKVLVMSGKGGVGKSTVAVNLAMSLSLAGRRVGLLDIDLHGPSVPKMLNMEKTKIRTAGHILVPAKYDDLFKVISLGFMLNNTDDAVVWRGPSKIAVIQQFLRDVEWDYLDFLIIDAPPGTGDEPLTVCQLIPDLDGAIIVTTPQDVALTDVRKSITFCKKIGIKIIGIVENMSNPLCPHCGKEVEVFGTGGGERLAKEYGVPFLARIPLDSMVSASGEAGKPFVYDYAATDTAYAFSRVVPVILKLKDIKPETDTVGYSDAVKVK